MGDFMYAQQRMRHAGSGPQGAFSNQIAWHAGVALAAVMLLAACAKAPPAPFAGPDPADASVPVRGTTYQDVTGGYHSERPAEPSPWTEQNQGVTPREKP
jgi:hypothetical protein